LRRRDPPHTIADSGREDAIIEIEKEAHMSLPPHRVDYSPIIDRPRLTWPHQARVAFWVAPKVEHNEYLPDHEGHRNPWPRTAYPDVREDSYRDYGNRVGFWRMLEVLDTYAI
jgi:hypothetical protein